MTTIRVAFLGESLPAVPSDPAFTDLPAYVVICDDSADLAAALEKAAVQAREDYPGLQVGSEGCWFYAPTAAPAERLSLEEWTARFLTNTVAVDDSGRLYGVPYDGAAAPVRHVQTVTPAPPGSGADLCVVVWEPEGVGGLEPEVAQLIQFLSGHLFLNGIEVPVWEAVKKVAPTVAAKGVARVPGRLRERRLKRVARQWADRKIDSPLMLRQWIHAKGEWIAEDVARGLSLEKKEAQALLVALGFEREKHDLVWRRSRSKRASRRLQEWLDEEF